MTLLNNLNVFFHNLLSCWIPKRIVKNIVWESYESKIDLKFQINLSKRFFNEMNCKKSGFVGHPVSCKINDISRLIERI